MFDDFLLFVRNIYSNDKGTIPLHNPVFRGNEKKYLNECIDTTFVSSVGKFVNLFEKKIAEYTGSKYAVAAVNGTAALHIALILSDVREQDEVITQPLTFIATVNAIRYVRAYPVFIDVDRTTLGLSPEKLEDFLHHNTFRGDDGFCYNKKTKNRIKACVPMHTFGHPVKIDDIKTICDKYRIHLIEDAAESLGSFYKNKHTGTFGQFGILSFNGNKIITTGGGGMILTENKKMAQLAKHLTTQAKVSHPWEYIHDHVGFNYRLTNLAAALGVAQLEQVEDFVQSKRNLAKKYLNFFHGSEIAFFHEPPDARSNYWLNTIILNNKKERDQFLKVTNNSGVMTRPVWRLMNKLKMFRDFQAANVDNAIWLNNRIVNIPSSVI